jgi:hypothetical protein
MVSTPPARAVLVDVGGRVRYLLDLAVPKLLLPGPGSYFQFARSAPEPAAPLTSSLQVRLKPGGGQYGYRG